MTHLSVIIPVYKAESCLLELYSRLKKTLETISSNFEIILVEDCGGDRSWEIIKELSKQDSRVKGFQFSRNFGQHYGITAGLDQCKGDWVVVMDCDLQDQPEEIPQLYKKAHEGFDVVFARRGKRKDTLYKRFCAWGYRKIFNILANIQQDPEVANFSIISKKVVISYRSMREQLRFFGGLITWLGFPVAYVTVQHADRFSGKSSYTFQKLLKLASETIIAYSDKPLHLAIKVGFLMSLIAFMFGISILIKALFYSSSVVGWSSIIVSLYFLGGIIIAILGVIGIYLGKTFDEVKKRPLYIIANKTNDDLST
jgi:glycosyltransferase involved in cell wall biosynthesis